MKTLKTAMFTLMLIASPWVMASDPDILPASAIWEESGYFGNDFDNLIERKTARGEEAMAMEPGIGVGETNFLGYQPIVTPRVQMVPAPTPVECSNGARVVAC